MDNGIKFRLKLKNFRKKNSKMLFIYNNIVIFALRLVGVAKRLKQE